MASIQHLSLELITLVIVELTPQDFFSFRATCKLIEYLTRPEFLQYFDERSVILERRSLGTLLEISRHHFLGASVYTLEVCVDYLSATYTDSQKYRCNEQFMDFLGAWSRHQEQYGSGADTREAFQQRIGYQPQDISLIDSDDDDFEGQPAKPQRSELYIQRLRDQEQLIKTGLDLKLLTQAMRNLPNCRSMIITNSTNCQRARHLAEEVGVSPNRSMRQSAPESIRHVYRVVQVALIAALNSKLQLREIGLTIGFLRDFTERVSPNMLVLPLSDSPQPTQSTPTPTFNSLTRLDLVLNPKVISISTEQQGEWEAGFLSFISLFPSLKRLELTFEYRDNGELDYEDMRFYINRGEEIRRFTGLSVKLYVPTLEIFDLSYVDCSEYELAFFLLRHAKTLRHASFSSVIITNKFGGWSWLARLIRDAMTITSYTIVDCSSEDSRPYSEQYQVDHQEGSEELAR